MNDILITHSMKPRFGPGLRRLDLWAAALTVAVTWAEAARSETSAAEHASALNAPGQAVECPCSTLVGPCQFGTPVRLTQHAAVDFHPAFSPDGSKIVFDSDRMGAWQIFVMDSVGGSVVRLTDGPSTNDHPRWFPDGTRILFESNRDGNKEMYSMNADGSDETRLTFRAGIDGAGMISPDGTRIAYISDGDGDWELYVRPTGDTMSIRLTNNSADDFGHAWSPDGSQITFMSIRDGNWEIYRIDADGTDLLRLTNDSTSDEEPQFAPDGLSIVFRSDRDGNYELYSMGVDGTNPVRLTCTETLDEGEIAWSPLCLRLAYASGQGFVTDIFVLQFPSVTFRLTEDTFRETVLSWSPDGRRLLFVGNKDGNLEIYTISCICD